MIDRNEYLLAEVSSLEVQGDFYAAEWILALVNASRNQSNEIFQSIFPEIWRRIVNGERIAYPIEP